MPLTLVIVDAGRVGNSGGGSSWEVPEDRFFAASLSAAQLEQLAGKAGLELYARLDLHDGRQLYVNRDGVPFRNFALSRAVLDAPA